MDDLSLIIPIRKIDEEKRLIIGRAVQEIPDKSGEIMDYETAKPAFEAWSKSFNDATGGMSKGNLRVMHGKTVAGKLTDMVFNDDDKAIDVIAKVVDDNEWKKCLEGVYTGFSVGGSYAKKWADPTNPALKRYTPRVAELSLVDTPCIPTARFYDLVKADGAVEQREFKVAEVEPPKPEPVYDSYSTLIKFNENHDGKGRFSSGPGAGESAGHLIGFAAGLGLAANAAHATGKAVYRHVATGLIRNKGFRVKPSAALNAQMKAKYGSELGQRVISGLRHSARAQLLGPKLGAVSALAGIGAFGATLYGSSLVGKLVGRFIDHSTMQAKHKEINAQVKDGLMTPKEAKRAKKTRKFDAPVGYASLMKGNDNHDPSNGQFSSSGGDNSDNSDDSSDDSSDDTPSSESKSSGEGSAKASESSAKPATKPDAVSSSADSSSDDSSDDSSDSSPSETKPSNSKKAASGALPKPGQTKGAKGLVASLPASKDKHKAAQDSNAGYNALTSQVIPEQRGGPIGYAAGVGLGAASLAPSAFSAHPGKIGDYVRRSDKAINNFGAKAGRFAGNIGGRVAAAAGQGVVSGALGGASHIANRVSTRVGATLSHAASRVGSAKAPGNIAGKALGAAGEAVGHGAARLYTGIPRLLGSSMTHATGSPWKAAALLGVAGAYAGSQTISPYLQSLGENVQTFFPRNVQKAMALEGMRLAKFNQNHDQKGRFATRDNAIAIGAAAAAGGVAGYAASRLAQIKQPKTKILRGLKAAQEGVAAAASAINRNIIKPSVKDASKIVSAGLKNFKNASPTKKIIYVAVAAAALKLAKPLLSDLSTYWNNLAPKLEVNDYGAQIHLTTKDKNGQEKKLKTFTYQTGTDKTPEGFNTTRDFGQGPPGAPGTTANVPGSPISGSAEERASKYPNSAGTYRDPSDTRNMYNVANDGTLPGILSASANNLVGSMGVRRQEAFVDNIDPNTYNEVPNARYSEMLQVARRDDQAGHMTRQQKAYLMQKVYEKGLDNRGKEATRAGRLYEPVLRDAQAARQAGGFMSGDHKLAIRYLANNHATFKTEQGIRAKGNIDEILREVGVKPGGTHSTSAPRPSPTPEVRRQDEHVSNITKEDVSDRQATQFAQREAAKAHAERMKSDMTDEEIARAVRQDNRHLKFNQATDLAKSVIGQAFDEASHPRLPSGAHGGGEWSSGSASGSTIGAAAAGFKGAKADYKVSQKGQKAGSVIPRIAENLAAYGGADIAGRIAGGILGNTPAGKLVQMGRVGAKLAAEVGGGIAGGAAANSATSAVVGPAAAKNKEGVAETVGRLVGGMTGYTVGAGTAALIGLPSGPGAIATGIAGGAIAGTAGEEIGGLTGKLIDKYGPEISARITQRFFS